MFKIFGNGVKMEKLILAVAFCYILYLYFEKLNLEKNRKKIKIVIHVNGIRGKSTVSRLIDAGIRAGGYRVFTKITGTSPRYISTDGKEYEIKRKGKPNIREQIKIFNLAVKEKAEILILECMAVRPEYQRICEEKILKADIGVITNVRADHLDEMGDTLDKIAESLSNTIPSNGVVFTGDKKYIDFFEKKSFEKKSKVIGCSDGLILEEYKKIDFLDNVELALGVCKYLGIDEIKALEGMKNYKRDPGVLKTIKFKNSHGKDIFFVNALAANDPDSSEIILNRIKEKEYWKYKKYLMVNNRKDRVSRWEQYIKFVLKLENNFFKIIVSGENQRIFVKKLLDLGIEKEKIILAKDENIFDEIEDNSSILAVGNICGKGREIINYLEVVGEIHE